MFRIDLNHAIPLIVGPTAVGKTSAGIRLARHLGGEIVSADARQVYRRLDVGTATPTDEELGLIPHHFVSELAPTQSFSAGQFARLAEKRITDIVERAHQPIVVGGSTLYVEALVNGISEIPDVDPDVRTLLNERLVLEGPSALFDELVAVDPASAATMDESKSQRIVRALEIYYGTGRRLSDYHTTRIPPAHRYSGILLARPRAELYDRINTRVDEMLSKGLVGEVQDLLAAGVPPYSNALRTIGYREVLDHLNGIITRTEMVRLIKRNTRRYAKRQMTWFRRYNFPEISADASVDELLSVIGRSRLAE